ncbi:MAG: PTS glucose transporter subunit IIA, partial [Collinsella sp.]
MRLFKLEATMGLLDSLKSTFTSTGEASVPPAASFATREGVIYAPVNGVLVNLNEVPDETIASGMLGQGYGIEPITGTIYAPANGRIGATTVTNHSIGMITEDGLRVFIHVGLGTVEMNGKGFARFVEMGDVV